MSFQCQGLGYAVSGIVCFRDQNHWGFVATRGSVLTRAAHPRSWMLFLLSCADRAPARHNRTGVAVLCMLCHDVESPNSPTCPPSVLPNLELFARAADTQDKHANLDSGLLNLGRRVCGFGSHQQDLRYRTWRATLPGVARVKA